MASDETPWSSPWAEALRSIADPHGTDAPEAGPVFRRTDADPREGWCSRRKRRSDTPDSRKENPES